MELWNTLVSRLLMRSDKQFAEAFLNRVHFKEIQNDSLIILSAEDDFSKGWFEKNYLPELIKILTEENLHYKFSIVTNPTQKNIPSPQKTAVSRSIGLPHLSSEFTFDLFIPGQCNDFPCHAAMRIVKGDHTFNPLVITGPIGSGKTHLAQALTHMLIKQSPEKRIVYVTSEEFMNDFVKSLPGMQGSNMNAFRDRYRNCSALIIDDIQFLDGRRKETAKELSNIFDTLISRGIPMVFTSDRPVETIKDFDERLRARLSGGLIADLKYPSFESRKAILITLAEKENLSIDDPVLTLIAETLEGDIRQLKSMLFKISAYADLKKKNVTLKMAREFLSDKIQIDLPKDLSIGDIQKAVAKFYGVTLSAIKSDSKLGAYTRPRQIAMFLASKHTKSSSTEIGQFFGKSHSTVLRSAQKIEENLPKSTDLRKQVEKILIELTDSHSR